MASHEDGERMNATLVPHIRRPCVVSFTKLDKKIEINANGIFGGSIHTIKKNKEALVVASKETGLEVNAEKTKYMVMSRDQNAG